MMNKTMELILVELLKNEYNSITALAMGLGKTQAVIVENIHNLNKIGFVKFLKTSPVGKTAKIAKKPVLTENGREAAEAIRRINELKRQSI